MARILLVDDEKVSRALYSDYLTGAGHHVTAVDSLQEAKRALSSGGNGPNNGAALRCARKYHRPANVNRKFTRFNGATLI